MKNKLITSLRTAATALETGAFPYEWNENDRCNCGVLFCTLAGCSPAQLKVPKGPNKNGNTWTQIAGYHCPVTGAPTHELFKALHTYGLTVQDIHELEYLSNKRVLERLATRTTKYGRWPWSKVREEIVPPELEHQTAQDVATYMRAWADLLVEEGQLDGASAPEDADVTPPKVVTA